MTSKTWIPGTVIDSPWLQDVNNLRYGLGTIPGSAFSNTLQSGIGAVSRTMQAKFNEQTSPEDFGALGDNTGRKPSDDGIVTTSAVWNVWPSFITGATYLTKPGHDYGNTAFLAANKPFTNADTWDFIGITLATWAVQSAGGGEVYFTGTNYVVNRTLRIVMGASGIGVRWRGKHRFLTRIKPLTTLAADTGFGSAIIYNYRLGLTGCSIDDMSITTYPLTGGTPAVEFDPALVGPNWESNGTYKCCILYNNCDSVELNNVFCSGYGEAGVVGLNVSSLVLNFFSTEYYTISVLLRGAAAGQSEAYVNRNVLFSSSGTGVNSWGTVGIYLQKAKAFVTGGQISAMRKGSVYSTGTNNELAFDGVNNKTDGYGLIFNCAGLDKWQVTNNIFQYGVPNTNPMVLIDGADGSVRPLNANFAGGQFVNNVISNVGGTSTYATLWITGTGNQITGNFFNDLCTGASTGNTVVNSLLNGSYLGPGTVNCIFTGNQLPNATPSMISVFGIVKDNIYTADFVGPTFVFAVAGTYTVVPGVEVITNGFAGTLTLTLPAVAQSIGMRISVSTVNAQAIVSASANVSPLAGGADGTAIVAATAGKWAELICNGTSWRIISGN